MCLSQETVDLLGRKSWPTFEQACQSQSTFIQKDIKVKAQPQAGVSKQQV